MTSVHENKIVQMANYFELDSNAIAIEYALFLQSIAYQEWISAYDDYVKEKAQKTEKVQVWHCLPSLLSVFKKFKSNEVYPNFFTLVKIVATLPSSSALCERMFSKVKMINTYLRVSMNSERVEDLVIIASEKEYADRIFLDCLVEAFKLSGNRKLLL